VYDGNQHFSIASIPEVQNNVISCYTFTKTYAMTGWRIGYIHAQESMIPQIKKAHIPFAICAPVISQYAAIEALKGSQDCVAEFHSHYKNARDLMCDRLDRLNHVFSYVKPTGSYLMFPKFLLTMVRFNEFLCESAARAKVSTTPGIAFGPNGEGHARMSFCVPEAEIDKAFDRMEDYFK